MCKELNGHGLAVGRPSCCRMLTFHGSQSLVKRRCQSKYKLDSGVPPRLRTEMAAAKSILRFSFYLDSLITHFHIIALFFAYARDYRGIPHTIMVSCTQSLDTHPWESSSMSLCWTLRDTWNFFLAGSSWNTIGQWYNQWIPQEFSDGGRLVTMPRFVSRLSWNVGKHSILDTSQITKTSYPECLV